MFFTLNQIKTIFKDFFSTHQIIRGSYYYKDDFDFNAERKITYPAVNAEFLDAVIADTKITYQFRFVIADDTETDNSVHEDNVHSDAIQVAGDLFAFLGSVKGLRFNPSLTLRKFTDKTGDRSSGITFDLDIQTLRLISDCVIPYKN